MEEEMNNPENRFGHVAWAPESKDNLPVIEKTPYEQEWNQYGRVNFASNETNSFSPILNPINKVGKRITTYHVMMLSVMFILIGVFYFSSVYEGSFLEFIGLAADDAPAQTAPVAHPRPTPRSNPAPATPRPPSPTSPPAPVVPFTPTATAAEYTQFENLVPSNELIQKLPSGAEINMIFFNRNRGYWESEKNYKLTQGSITPGQYSEPDFKFVMNARWVPQFTATNFCDIMQQARAAGESDAEAFGSKISLGWKYKSIIGDRDCWGF